MNRSPLRRVSKKRQAENVRRRAILHATFGTHPRCQLCEPLAEHGIVTGCDGWADDAHEILTRGRGGSITDVENIVPIGRDCHRWVHGNPSEATEFGFLRTGAVNDAH